MVPAHTMLHHEHCEKESIITSISRKYPIGGATGRKCSMFQVSQAILLQLYPDPHSIMDTIILNNRHTGLTWTFYIKRNY